MSEITNGKYIDSIKFHGTIEQDSYLLDIPSVQYLMKTKVLDLTSNVTFFVGENGTGKSTLIEAIAIAYGFNAEGGTKNEELKICNKLITIMFQILISPILFLVSSCVNQNGNDARSSWWKSNIMPQAF